MILLHRALKVEILRHWLVCIAAASIIASRVVLKQDRLHILRWSLQLQVFVLVIYLHSTISSRCAVLSIVDGLHEEEEVPLGWGLDFRWTPYVVTLGIPWDAVHAFLDLYVLNELTTFTTFEHRCLIRQWAAQDCIAFLPLLHFLDQPESVLLYLSCRAQIWTQSRHRWCHIVTKEQIFFYK